MDKLLWLFRSWLDTLLLLGEWVEESISNIVDAVTLWWDTLVEALEGWATVFFILWIAVALMIVSAGR